MVIMAEEEAKRQGIEPLAIVTGAGMGACAPDMMGCSPVPAVQNLMKRTGRKSVDEWDRVEVNEVSFFFFDLFYHFIYLFPYSNIHK